MKTLVWQRLVAVCVAAAVLMGAGVFVFATPDPTAEPAVQTEAASPSSAPQDPVNNEPAAADPTPSAAVPPPSQAETSWAVTFLQKDLTRALSSGLSFNSEAKFKIMQISDTEIDAFVYPTMLKFLQEALEREKPDLVIFTGDITNGTSEFFTLHWIALPWILDLLGNTPFTFVFGDTDAGIVPNYKNTLLKAYQNYPNCLAFDDLPETDGVGNHNLFVFKSAADAAEKKLEHVAFNLYMIDTNTRKAFSSELDGVHNNQVEWFQSKQWYITQQAGFPLQSMLFLHAPLPETYAVLDTQQPGTTIPTRRYNNTDFQMTLAGEPPLETIIYKLDEDTGLQTEEILYQRGKALKPERESALLEFPDVPQPTENRELFRAIMKWCAADNLAIVSGHNHTNRFVRAYEEYDQYDRRSATDFIQTPGVGFNSYGDPKVRGVRIIELEMLDPGCSHIAGEEHDPTDQPLVGYSTHTLDYFDRFDFNDTSRKNFYQAGANWFFAWNTNWISLGLSIFGVNKYQTAYDLTQWFGDTFSFIL